MDQKPRLKKVEKVKLEPTYKNVTYKNGNIRPDISRHVLYQMASKYGDILRAVSTTKWVTADEVADTYWHMNNALRRRTERGMPGIREALKELVASGLILER